MMAKKLAKSAHDLTKVMMFKNLDNPNKAVLSIFHFNDVYDIYPKKYPETSAASRFTTALKLIKKQAPNLVFFSGDAFSPSSC